MPITNLRKKKLKEISFFDLSQKAKKQKVFVQKCIYWLIGSYGKLQNWRQSQSLPELSLINLILHYGKIQHFFPIKYCLLTQFKSHSDNFIKGQPKYHKFTSVSCYRMAILVLLLLVFTIYIHIIKCHPHLGARLINDGFFLFFSNFHIQPNT